MTNVLASQMMYHPGNSEEDPHLEREREQEVLAILVEMRTNRQIAESLYISESTVKNHVSNILRKLGLESRHEAAALAARRRNASD